MPSVLARSRAGWWWWAGRGLPGPVDVVVALPARGRHPHACGVDGRIGQRNQGTGGAGKRRPGPHMHRSTFCSAFANVSLISQFTGLKHSVCCTRAIVYCIGVMNNVSMCHKLSCIVGLCSYQRTKIRAGMYRIGQRQLRWLISAPSDH
jgi:hypothetical protein